MGTGVVGQGVLTAVFVALAVHSGWAAVTASGRPARVVGAVLHLIMSVDMAAMVWPWWDRVPVVPQFVVFGAGSVWYAVRAGRHLTRHRAAGPPGRAAWPALMHTLMMAAMLWMVAVMAGSSSGSASGHDHAALADPVALLGVGLTAGLLVAGFGTVVTLIETRRDGAGSRKLLGIGADSVMSLAMGVACWLMLVD